MRTIRKIHFLSPNAIFHDAEDNDANGCKEGGSGMLHPFIPAKGEGNGNVQSC